MSGRGWREDLRDGFELDEVSVPVNMPLRLWEAMIEALEATPMNNRDVIDAYLRMTAMRDRVKRFMHDHESIMSRCTP